MDVGATLKPSANVSILQISQAAKIIGGNVDTRDYAGWNKVGILIDGADYSTDGFWLHESTQINGVNLRGKSGFDTGTAVKFAADTSTTARIIGVDADFRAWGFEIACGFWVGNNAGANFITANTIRFRSSGSWRAIYCVDPSVYNIAGNEIWMQHQPDLATTVPAIDFIGQLNNLTLLPWDWDAVSGVSPYALVLKPGARFNRINIPISHTYINVSSGQTSNFILAADGINLADGRIVGRLHPPYLSGGSQTNVAIYAGGDAPSDSFGNNGDFYFRSSGGAGSCIYQKRAGNWYATGA